MKGFRDGTTLSMFQNLVKYVQQVEQSARLGITGEAVRAQAFQKLLIKKGLITEAELTEAIGEVIREANTPKPEEVATATEAPKVEITTPTPEQVSEVQKSIEETK
jgi:hypothetical protein